MSAPSVIALPDSSAAGMHARGIAALLAPTLLALWIGEDLAVSAGNVVSGHGRPGATLVNSTVKRFGATTVNGRIGTTPNGTGDKKSLEAALSAIGVYYWVILKGAPVGIDYERVIDCAIGDGGQILRMIGGSFYTLTGWAHRVDNVATENSALTHAGIHMVSAEKAASTGQGIVIGGQSGDVRVFTGNVLSAGAASAIPAAAKQAELLRLNRSYYSF